MNPFAKGACASNNPRRGIMLSAAIAFATIGIGNLNLIAPVVSMFFLISYGLLNYATWFEAKAASPSFRPRFRWFDHRLSLAGGLACLGAMLAIDLKTGIVAVSLLFAIFQYLKRTSGPSRWADSRRSYNIHQVLENLKEGGRRTRTRPGLAPADPGLFRQSQAAGGAAAICRLGKNIIILDPKNNPLEVPPKKRRIDIWWWDDATGRLMLLQSKTCKSFKPGGRTLRK